MSVRRHKASVSTPVLREAWWIAGSDVDCSHCFQGYAYEREVRCVVCDAPVCPFCVVRVEARVVCQDCAPQGEE
jgi:hypothetical protein